MSPPDELAAQFEDMNSAITDGALRPVVAQVFGFDHALDAFAF